MACSKFSGGVHPKVFRVARRLVENRRLHPYSHLSDGDYQYLESQTNGATAIVLGVLYEAHAEGLQWPLDLVGARTNEPFGDRQLREREEAKEGADRPGFLY